jgi:hypothetical protein
LGFFGVKKDVLRALNLGAVNMKIIGYYIPPSGPHGLILKTAYYDLRLNQKLGLQALVEYLGSIVWINIDKEWLA